MKNTKDLINSLLVLLILLCGACAPVLKNELGKEEYMAWVDQNEENKMTKKINGIEYTLTYFPPEYMLYLNHDVESYSREKTDSILAEYKGYDYYMYQVKIDGFGDEIAKYKLSQDADYAQRIQYYAFDMQHQIKEVLNDRDTVPCIVYTYERNYGTSPANRFMIGFKKDDPAMEKTVIINNRYLPAGTVKFTFSKDHSDKLPVLKQ